MCRWSKPWILSSSQWLLTFRPWKTSWQRRREESSIWRYEPLTLRQMCFHQRCKSHQCMMMVFLLYSMIMRRAGPDTTRRRNSSSVPGTRWWASKQIHKSSNRNYIHTTQSLTPSSFSFLRPLHLSGNGTASESVWWAAGFLQPGHVLPRPAETTNQRKEGPDTTPPEMRHWGVTVTLKWKAKCTQGDPCELWVSFAFLCLHWDHCASVFVTLLLPPAGSYWYEKISFLRWAPEQKLSALLKSRSYRP